VACTSHDMVDDPLEFFVLAVALGFFVKWIFRWCNFKRSPPYTIVLFLLGFAFSAYHETLGLSDVIQAAQQPPSSIIFYVLLPPLLFDAAMNMDPHVFNRVKWQVRTI
jgi:NhaP-type Na+/H+ or K+/H+ antiporter